MLFKRDVLIDWDGGNLKISFSRLDIEVNHIHLAEKHQA